MIILERIVTSKIIIAIFLIGTTNISFGQNEHETQKETNDSNCFDKIEELTIDKLRLSNEMKDSKEKNISLSKQIKEMELQIQELLEIKSNSNSLISENKVLSEKAKQLEEGSNELKKNRSKLKSEVESLKEKLNKDKRNKEIAELKNINQKNSAELLSIKEKNFEQAETIKSLEDSLKVFKDIQQVNNNLHKRNNELIEQLKECNSKISDTQGQLQKSEKEVESLNVMKELRIEDLAKSVDRIVLSSTFRNNHPELSKLELEVEKLLQTFSQNSFLQSASLKISDYKNVANILSRANAVTYESYNKLNVNNSIKSLRTLSTNLPNAKSKASQLAIVLQEYCQKNNLVYSTLIDVDIYGNNEYKKEDIDNIRPQVNKYSYLTKALDDKVNSGFRKGSPLVSAVKCSN